MPVKTVGKNIVETLTGKVVGHSKNAETAKSAARIRNAMHKSNWKPTKGPKKMVREGGVDRK